MVFSSITFLLYFLPLFLWVYHLSGRRYRNIVLLLSSIVFYAWGAPRFVFILLASTILDFYLVQWMHRSANRRRKKLWLALSVGMNVGLLAFFKYANFFVDNVNACLAGLGAGHIAWVDIALPIGISFYTFQTLTYSIDVYRGLHPPLRKASDYVLYIIMFPQLIAGPIVRFHEIAGQIEMRDDALFLKLQGMYRFAIGLAKKVLIANVMGQMADQLIGMPPEEVGMAAAWLGILAYAFQIYFDFSGYSDMAIGLGLVMGFRFPENFNNPYTARSITEFWRRWHITLGTWMRDYLYIPLGGNRVSARRIYLNLWVVFLLSGLWHGAAWNFVLWGAYHGLFLVAERWFLLDFYKKIGQWASLAATFMITLVGWAIFRIESLGHIGAYIWNMFSFKPGHIAAFDSLELWAVLGVAAFFSFFVLLPGGQRVQERFYTPGHTVKNCWGMFLLTLVLLVLSIGSISTSAFNPFIYFRF
ncbi:MAG: MBOAT family protein [Lewinellaceae bacterium]|nr:MBOAT family protein [Saprospiraceae bacterium]MCB9341272.1 MBOAT family protein [Lewinellaceae bacterium]